MSRLLTAATAAVAVAVAGCPTPPDGTADGGCELCTESCAAGFVPRTDGPGCQPVHASDCPAGTRPQLGTQSCVPVGWTDCGPHFETDPSGWGCRPRLPPGDCGPWGLAVPGEAACLPLDDCDAPFPPAGATHFVDPGFADAELDATHVRTISEALTAAGPGSVIAVERGDYTESLRPTATVTLVGRCAAETRVLGSGLAAGLTIGGSPVRVRRISFWGHRVGVRTSAGSTLTLEEVALVDNRDLGVLAEGAGATVVIDRSLVRGTLRASGGVFGYGVLAQTGGRVEATLSALEDNAGAGLVHLESSTSGRVARCSILGGTPGTDAVRGVSAERGAQVEVEDTLIGGLPGSALFVGSEGSMLAASRLHVGRGADGGEATAVWVQDGGSVAASDVTFAGVGPHAAVALGSGAGLLLERAVISGVAGAGETFGIGVNVLRGARASLFDTAVTGVAGVGVAVHDAGTSATLTGSLVRETLRHTDPSASGGLGWGVWADEGAVLEADDLAVLDSHAISAVTTGAAAQLRLSRSLVRSPPPGADRPGTLGIAVLGAASLELAASSVRSSTIAALLADGLDTQTTVWDSTLEASVADLDGTHGHGGVFLGGTRAILRRVTLRGNRSIGLAFETSFASVDDCAVVSNEVGIHVQGGTTLVEGDASGEPTPGTVRVSPDTVFVDNGVRVGSGAAALPSPGSVISGL